MLHRCLLFLVVASLAVSGGAAWATNVFVDISATASNAQFHPTGVAPGGVAVMQGILPGQPTLFYHTFLYPGGTTGTMADITSLFGALRLGSSNMNASGQFTVCRTSTLPNNGWLDSNGTVTSFTYPSSYSTYSVGVNNNGDVSGFYRPTGGSDPMHAFVWTGGTCYDLSSSAYNSCISALNTSGQGVGWVSGGSPPRPEAEVWSYTISGGSLTAQSAINLQTTGGLATVYPSVCSSVALAINSTGQVVVAANNTAQMSAPLRYGGSTATFIYDMSAHTYTSLGSLSFYDDQVNDGTGTQFGGHAQAINDSSQVVGRIDAGGGVYHAAIWESGTITDLNTRYAGILPSGFVLQNATAIDNGGDIAGWGTDGTNNVQAFVIYNAVPEPGTLALLLAGSVGLLAYAWRKRK